MASSTSPPAAAATCFTCDSSIPSTTRTNECVVSLSNSIEPYKGKHSYCDDCLKNIPKCAGCALVPQLNCCLLSEFTCGQYECPVCFLSHQKHCRIKDCTMVERVSIVNSDNDSALGYAVPGVLLKPLNETLRSKYLQYIDNAAGWKTSIASLAKQNRFNDKLGLYVRTTNASNFRHDINTIGGDFDNRRYLKEEAKGSKPIRKLCYVCGRKSRFCCKLCKVALCSRAVTDFKDNEGTCFQYFHSSAQRIGLVRKDKSKGVTNKNKRKKNASSKDNTTKKPPVVVEENSSSDEDVIKSSKRQKPSSDGVKIVVSSE